MLTYYPRSERKTNNCAVIVPLVDARQLQRMAYIANQFPLGTSETFIWPEVTAHREAGVEIVFCPIAKGRAFHNTDALRGSTLLVEPLISPRVLLTAFFFAVSRPALFWAFLASVLRGPLKVIVRNLAVLPKAIWLGERLRTLNVDHIHAHWLSTPATAAMIASIICGVGYSITAHRIDISQGNLIPQKLKTADFVRAIDAKGRDEIRACDPRNASKVTTIYLGTSIPTYPAPVRNGVLNELRLVTAARLVEKKGHSDLIAAVSLAQRRGTNVRVDIFGEGPLAGALQEQARHLGVETVVLFKGPLPHPGLLTKIRGGEYDASVLPSITARDGDREGIPAFLMESMAAGLPVISTDNGGVTELVLPGTGIILRERDPEGLASAMLRIARDPQLRSSLAVSARARAIAEFDVSASAARLRRMMGGDQLPELTWP